MADAASLEDISDNFRQHICHIHRHCGENKGCIIGKRLLHETSKNLFVCDGRNPSGQSASVLKPTQK